MLERDAAGRSLWVLYIHLGYGELRPACFHERPLGADADLRLRWNPTLRGLLTAVGPNEDYLNSSATKLFMAYVEQLGDRVQEALVREAHAPYRRPRPRRRNRQS